MGLWTDKYRPISLDKLDYHKEQAKYLKNLVSKGDFPHLLVYGPSGAGKKTRVMCLLRELYGAGVERLRMEQMSFQTPSNKKVELMTISSNYHIEVNPSDVGMYDKVVVMDLVKSAAQTQQLDSSGQREFKVLVLTEVDQLSKDAQHALRRTMEKYTATCRLILVAQGLSRILPAIKSRCLAVRVPAPSVEDICRVLIAVCRKECLTLPEVLAVNIAMKSERNLRRALLMCEACKVARYPFTEDQELVEPDWQVYLRETARGLVAQQSQEKLQEVRGRLYELLCHGIPGDVIFKGLLIELVKNCDMGIKMEIAEAAAIFEHRMHLGSKPIFHLEAFVAKFMAIYSRYLEISIADNMYGYCSDDNSVVAIGCARVGDEGNQPMLARVCIVNKKLNLIYNEFVQPRAPVKYYWGMRKENILNGANYHQVRWNVRKIMYEADFVVGHDIIHDLNALRFSLPRYKTVDLIHFPKFVKYSREQNGGIYAPSLKYLAKYFLRESIQEMGRRDPVESAVTMMKLFLMYVDI